MLTIRKLISACCITALLFSSAVFVPVNAAEEPDIISEFGDTQEVKTYIDEFDFTNCFVDNTDTNYDARERFSGWKQYESGGLFTRSYSAADTNINDYSEELPVYMTKQVETITFGKLGWRFGFKTDANVDGAEFYLGCGAEPTVMLYTNNGKLWLKQEGGNDIDLGVCKPSKWNGIITNINIDERTVDVYINGQKKAEKAGFSSATKTIDNVYLGSGRERTGTVTIDETLSLERGYRVLDTFATQFDDKIPEFYEDISTAGKAVMHNFGYAKYDTYALELDTTEGSAAAKRSFDPINRNFIVEYMQFAPSNGSPAGLTLKNADKDMIDICFNNGKINVLGNSIYNYTENLWYRIYLDINVDDKTADVWVNGKLMKKAVKINESTADCFVVYADMSDNLPLFDNFKVYPKMAEPNNYIEAPVIPAKKRDDTYLGMQVCSLWREGKHSGWEVQNHYKERTPYLGYYDEGSPEVADWEIKWMAEHGIDFEYYCWYRSGKAGEPIELTDHSEAIHDGFMHAKYSDSMKFAIFYENANSLATNMTDFKTNIVPYWIEYFFKDERYATVDGRPIIGVYDWGQLSSAMGGTAGVREAIEYLASECEKLGIGRPYWMVTTSDYSESALKTYKDGGMDANYSYHAKYATMGQLKTILEGRVNEYIDVVPPLAVGFNGRSWGQNKWDLHYGLAYPDEYEALCKWVFDSYLPNIKKSTSKNVVTVNTWNEYGEGTVVAPAGMEGFNYLEAIRNTFTKGGTHNDRVPTREEKDRFNNLYPHTAIKPHVKKESVPQMISENVKYSFTFNSPEDLQAWTTNDDIKDIRVQNGVLVGDIIGKEPSLTLHKELELDDVNAVRIKLKNSTASRLAYLYWKHKGKDVYNDENLEIEISHLDKEAKEYTKKTWDIKTWNGTVDEIKIVPTYNGVTDIKELGLNRFEIERIDFLAGDNTENLEGIYYVVDGVPYNCVPPAIVEDNEVYVPMRSIRDIYDMLLEWDPVTNAAHLASNKLQKFLSANLSSGLLYNRERILEGVPKAFERDGISYVPIQALNLMNFDMEFDKEAGCIRIYKQSKKIEEDKSASTKKREVLRGYEFNQDGNFEGWTVLWRITNSRVEDGALKGTISGTDNSYTIDGFEPIEADKVKNIAINIKNKTNCPYYSIYFATDDGPDWSASRWIRVNNMATDSSSFAEYNVDPGKYESWKGMITALRIDVPAWTTGDFEIDSFRLEGDFIDQSQQKFELPALGDTPGDAVYKDDCISWNFNSNSHSDGWVFSKDFANLVVSDGSVFVDVIGDNAAMRPNTPLKIKAEDFNTINIKMKNKTSATKAKLYFTTDKDKEYSEPKCYEFDIKPNDTVGTKYTIDMTSNPLWSGTIDNIQIKTEGGAGELIFDYIEIKRIP